MEEFLRALYDDLPAGAWWYLWTLSADQRTKATYWVQSVTDAVDVAQRLEPVHVYYPICWAAQCGNAKERVKSHREHDSDILPAGIIGLVADVDFHSADHPHAPPCETDALFLCEKFPLPPTYCVHSGHGLHLGWLFKEPWAFGTPQECQTAAELSRSWAYTLMSIASKHSYELDAVHDLSRVMRLPGTYNVKDPERPVRAELRWMDDTQRYNPDEFSPYLVDVPTLSKTPLPAIDLGADFPTAKHEALLDVSPEYAETWRHTRRFEHDNSCSAYDWHLAKFAVWAQWTDDEIAALIRENQREHGTKHGKDLDNKYIGRTIARARDAFQEEAAQHRAAEVIEDDHAGRDKQIQALATMFDIELTNIQFVNGDPAIVRLWVGGKPADVLATRMTTPAEFMAQITSVAKKMPRPLSKTDKQGWRHYVNTMLTVAETIDAGPDATVDGSFRDLLTAFLEIRGVREVERGELLTSTAPFHRDGRVWFRLEDFTQYERMHGDRSPRKVLVQRLKIMGAEPRHHKLRRNGRGDSSTTARFYGVPEQSSSETEL
jgi:hypothetical protein